MYIYTIIYILLYIYYYIYTIMYILLYIYYYIYTIIYMLLYIYYYIYTIIYILLYTIYKIFYSHLKTKQASSHGYHDLGFHGRPVARGILPVELPELLSNGAHRAF